MLRTSKFLGSMDWFIEKLMASVMPGRRNTSLLMFAHSWPAGASGSRLVARFQRMNWSSLRIASSGSSSSPRARSRDSSAGGFSFCRLSTTFSENSLPTRKPKFCRRSCWPAIPGVRFHEVEKVALCLMPRSAPMFG